MFKSITYKSYDYGTDHSIYELEDSEFGIIELIAESELVLIVREYSKRNLNVGKNLALFILWDANRIGYTAKELFEGQETYCIKHIANWPDYASSTDEWLSKLLLIQ